MDNAMEVDTEQPLFPALPAGADEVNSPQYRKVPIPSHRLSPLKRDWLQIYTPLVQHLGLQVRFNLKGRCIELRTPPTEPGESKQVGNNIQRAADFCRAYAMGFVPADAMVLLRVDDMYIDSFEIKDVKTLQGEHLARAIGRLAGKDGRTRATIENVSRTRIVLADSKIHILGSYRNIRVAKDAIVSLIMGSTPGKVYNRLRNVSARLTERSL